jgi:hypothetical protein
MWHGPIELRPLDSPSGAQLRQQREALHDKANTLQRPEFRAGSQDSMGTIRKAQRTYCWHSAQACADCLLASLHDRTEDSKRAPAGLLG